MNKKIFNSKNFNSGFSLVEIVVAVGIFSIVMAVIVTFFNQSVVSQRRVLSSQNIQDNMRYAIEFMMREIRMGSDFDVGAGAQNLIVPDNVPSKINFLGSDTLKFTNYKGESVIYSWDKNYLGANYHRILRNGEPIISANVEVYDFAFFLSQDLTPLRITIIMKARLRGANKTEESVPLILQTTISPRSI